MNALEHALCSSSLWRHISKTRLLPWLLAGSQLGDHVLEIGAGYGAATGELRARAARVTSLEYDPISLSKLKANLNGGTGAPVCGDAAILPFADQSFSSATAILVLHHLKSGELQDRAVAETFRVLRPGGVFLAFEINHSWIHRVGHIKSTYTPLAPDSVFARLRRAGFARVSVDVQVGGFRIRAARPREGLDLEN
jgi:SAM-dependent methyltransferase